MSDLEQPDFEW